MCLVPFGPISRVWSTNACRVARVVCQEPPEPCTTLKEIWTLGVVTDHRTEGGVAKGERAKKNVVSIKGLGVILSTSETRPTLENPHAAQGGTSGTHLAWGAASPAGVSCWHAAQTPIFPPHGAGCTKSDGASRQRSQIWPTRG